MAERLAALGLRAPSKSGETAQQRQEREKKEREDRLRQAEEEDQRREQERLQRLEAEGVIPPSVGKADAKKPPPPPSRKNKAESPQSDKNQWQAEMKRADNEIAGQALREQQEAQEAETKQMEYVVSSKHYTGCNRLMFFTETRSSGKNESLPKSRRPLRLVCAPSKSK